MIQWSKNTDLQGHQNPRSVSSNGTMHAALGVWSPLDTHQYSRTLHVAPWTFLMQSEGHPTPVHWCLVIGQCSMHPERPQYTLWCHLGHSLRLWGYIPAYAQDKCLTWGLSNDRNTPSLVLWSHPLSIVWSSGLGEIDEEWEKGLLWRCYCMLDPATANAKWVLRATYRQSMSSRITSAQVLPCSLYK